MKTFTRWFADGVSLGVLALVAVGGSAARAQGDGLHLLHEPGGGEIVYGPISNANTLQAGAGVMLRSLHGHFGDRPQIGKLFQEKGSNSVSMFFSVTDNNGSHKAITGLMIVAMTAGGSTEGAVVYDETPRFAGSEGGMMKRLNEVWHPGGGGGSARGGAQGVAQPLRQTPFPDNSGSIGLPAGWRITAGHQGAVDAVGPTGSEIHYGVVVPVMDPNNPQTRSMIQMETQGGRMPLPGMYVAIPYGTDAVRAFLAAAQQLNQKARKPQMSFNVTSTKRLGGLGGGGDCALVEGTMDRHDGTGSMYSENTICMNPPMGGNWMLTIYQANIRQDMVQQEKPTLEAMASSYKMNGAVMNEESQEVISQIHQIGADTTARINASHEAFDQKLASDRANEDRVDRSNQNFSNYILDQTVVQNVQTGERGTVFNKYADSLVQNDPNRFQYVPTQDMLKGIDY